MDKVPTMISTKDLAYLEDIFNWNFTASKKASNYSNEVTDEELKNTLVSVANMHKEICESILGILE